MITQVEVKPVPASALAVRPRSQARDTFKRIPTGLQAAGDEAAPAVRGPSNVTASRPAEPKQPVRTRRIRRLVDAID